MAKLKSPLFSLEASNKLGPLSLRRHTLGQAIAGAKPIPTQPQTWPQKYHRWLYTDYVHWWGALISTERNAWKPASWRLGITPYNAFMANRLRLKPDIAAAYHLDELSGLLAQDLSHNNNDATIFGASHAEGYLARALNFDGIDDYIEAAAPEANFTSEDFTLMAWIKPTSATGGRRIIDRGQINTSGYIFMLGSDYALYFYSCQAGANQESKTLSNTITLGVWTHVAFTRTGGTTRFYKNGVINRTQTIPVLNPLTSALSLRIGAGHPASSYFQGLIDEPRIYNRRLSDFDIAAHFARR